jgi:hypothetical protein
MFRLIAIMKRGTLIPGSRRKPACVHPAPTMLRAGVGHPIDPARTFAITWILKEMLWHR